MQDSPIEWPDQVVSIATKLGRPILPRQVFIDYLKQAIDDQSGFAAGKLGTSQQHWMIYPILLEESSSKLGIRLFEKKLLFHGLKNAGIFPGTTEFFLKYNAFYIKHVRNLDSVGVFLLDDKMENVIIRYYDLQRLIHYQNQEPDRSPWDKPANCYLQYFRDKRLLLICPFAELLRERANRETFEGVWSKTGKKWFYPSQIEALEFPYGFSPKTHAQYATAFDLLDNIKLEIARRNFDVALIAAAGLAIPMASFIKNMGKVAIDLGGHLQVLFGVIGRRWRYQTEWRQQYFNEYWVDMPARYRPEETDVCDQGAYW